MMEKNAMNTPKPVIVTALVLLIGAIALSACFPGVPRIADPITTSAIHTAAAATIAAEATLAAGNTAVAQLTQMAQSPSQPTASSTPLTPSTTAVTPATATQVPPSATATLFVPTATATFVIPTPVPPTQAPPIYIPPQPPPPTPVPWYPTPVPLACDWVQFVSDVSVPDNTRLTAGQSFTKTWRLRNIGACTWTPQYALVFVNGDRMQAPAVIPLNRNVRPGETVDLSVNLVAPAAPGDYRGNWMLSNQFGYEFGIGSDARKAFWVDIIVQAVSSRYPYDFTANVCNATWRSSSRVLPCPGNSESEAGSVVVLTDPTLETGRHENEPAIWTRPHASRAV